MSVGAGAGSASGVIPNPVGDNRVYVHVGKAFCQFFSPDYAGDLNPSEILAQKKGRSSLI